MKRVLIVLVLAAVVMGVRMSQWGDTSEARLDNMKELIQGLDVYHANSEYLDHQIELAHMKAFSDAYEAGGRRRAGELDEEQYIDAFFSSLLVSVRRWCFWPGRRGGC